MLVENVYKGKTYEIKFLVRVNAVVAIFIMIFILPPTTIRLPSSAYICKNLILPYILRTEYLPI